jgi:hypothetical protein
MLGRGDVDERPFEGRDGDAVQFGAVVGVQPPLVDDEAGQPAPALSRGRHVDLRAVVGEDAVGGARRAVREVGVRPGSQGPGQPPAVEREHGVPERIAARIEPHEQARLPPPRGRRPPHPGRPQVPDGDDPVMPRRHIRHAPNGTARGQAGALRPNLALGPNRYSVPRGGSE